MNISTPLTQASSEPCNDHTVHAAPGAPTPAEAPAAAPVTFEQIQAATRRLAQARLGLAVALGRYREQVRLIRRVHEHAIVTAATAAGEVRQEVVALLERGPELFVSPRLRKFEGIEVGYRKRAGTVSWEDDETVLARIKKHLPQQAALLIQTRETPNKTALRLLQPDALKRLACAWEEGSDAVVIRFADELDRELNAWQADAAEAASAPQPN